MPDGSRIKRMLRRGLAGAVLVAAAGVLGYLLAPGEDSGSAEESAGATSLTVRTVQYAAELPDPDAPQTRGAVDSLIRAELARRVRLPRIERMELEGVNVQEVTAGARVPVLVYRQGEVRVPVFVYNYALLDVTRDELTLPPGTLEQLDREEIVVDRSGERPVVLWRSRDDIFLAVTSGEPDSLAARIERTSSS